ncbi:MAG: hypothetical protein QM831_26075 [Kofleriaceae bacterium]
MRTLLVSLLIACGGGSTPAPTGPTQVPPPATPVDAAPPALEDDPGRLAQKSVEMYQAIAKAVTEAKDCAAATQSLNSVADANQDVIAANAKTLHAGHDKIQKLKAALEPHEQDLQTAAQTIGNAQIMKSCSGDPNFAKAADRLLGEP